MAQKIYKLYNHDNPSVFPAAISTLLLGYALCQLKSWISQTYLTISRNAWLQSIYSKGGKPALWYGLVMAEPAPAPKWREEQFSDSSGNMEPHAMHAKHQPPLPYIQLLVASHLWAGARQAQLRALCITSAWALLSASPLGSFPPAKWLHPVIPVCSDCIFLSFWNKVRTELCSFPTFLPCFVTVLQEASRTLYLKQDS